MPKIRYKQSRMREEALGVVVQANAILAEYEAQGFDLTLRQLYYQFVARGLIPNRQREYKRLGTIVNEARLAGWIDWDSIVDRTRNLRSLGHWDDPGQIVRGAAWQYARDLWATQPVRIEVWIEKDALVGVIDGVCTENDVPYFSCRGYTSQSEMWAASQRLVQHLSNGQDVRILHLGDHDPSGIDMTRDIDDRLQLFITSHAVWGDIEGVTVENGPDAWQWTAAHFSVERLALNMDQVAKHAPPPNPAKITDSRAAGYIAEHGYESWELDALPPDVLAALIEAEIASYREFDAWEVERELEERQRRTLAVAAERWEEVATFLAS